MSIHDFIVSVVYALGMVGYLVLCMVFDLPSEAFNLFYIFILFIPLQKFMKKFFVSKRTVGYNKTLIDSRFSERPFRTSTPYIHILKRRCRFFFFPAKYGLIMIMICLMSMQFSDSIFLYLLITLLAISIPVFTKLYKYNYETLENLYKTEIELMFQEYIPEMNYYAFDGIREEDYKFADFSKFDLFESEDYIYGTTQNRDFSISEVSTYIKHEDENGKVSYTLDFQGTCGIINIMPPINSFIYLVAPGLSISINGLKVTVDNYKFNSNYDIFTNSELATNLLLTPSYMQKLLDFREKFGVYVEIKIHYDVVFFRFHTGNLFAPSIFGKDEDKEFALYFQMIYQIYELMNDTVKVLDKIGTYSY